MTEQATRAFSLVPLGVGAAGLTVGIVLGSAPLHLPLLRAMLLDPLPAQGIVGECAVAAGARLTASSIRIACGLSREQIAAIVREAVAGFDLGSQLARLREGQRADPALLEALAGALGLAPEAAEQLLARLAAAPQQSEPPEPAEELARMVIERPQLVVALTGPEPRPDGFGAAPSAILVDLAQETRPEQSAEREARAIVARCAAVAGKDITVEQVELDCGPDRAEIEALITTIVDGSELSELLAELRAGSSAPSETLAALAEVLGLQPASLRTLLGALAAEEVESSALPERLAGLAAAHQELALRLWQLDAPEPEVRALRDAAAMALAEGDHERAQALLAEAESLARHPLLEAARRALAARRLADDAPAAAALLLEATELVSGEDELLATAYRAGAAALLGRHAAASIDRAALDQAVREYRTIMETLPAVTLEVAPAYGQLLLRAGEAELDLDALRAAASAYRRALRIVPEPEPETLAAWAELHNGLGWVLIRIGERGRDPAPFGEAQTAFRAVLEQLEAGTSFEGWSRARNGLAVTLHSLGRLERRGELLGEAVAAYESLLEALDPATDSEMWAAAKNNLANALLERGRMEGDASLLARAIESYREALAELSPGESPHSYAMFSNNLAHALLERGLREADAQLIAQAIEHHRKTLRIYTREDTPPQWADANNALGDALFVHAEMTGRTAPAREALAAYEAALSVLDPALAREDFARTQTWRGHALVLLARLGSDPEPLQDAIDAYRQSLEATDSETAFDEWLQRAESLGFALETRAELAGEVAADAGAIELLAAAADQAASAGRAGIARALRDRLAKLGALPPDSP